MYILEPSQYELVYNTAYSGTVKIFNTDISDTNINVICAKLSEELDFYYVLYLNTNIKNKTKNVYEFTNIAIGSLNSVEYIDRKEKLKYFLK